MKAPVGAVMVCGGGIAGIQSALDLANSGYKVYLVEKSPSIGGKMAQLDKTFPTGDCATCIVSPKLVECTRNLNIEILTLSELESLTGEPGNFTARVKQKSRYIDIDKCTACGDCEKVCPVSLPSDFNRGLNKTTAIHKTSAQAAPNAYVITKRKTAPCVSACPMGQNAQAYVALAAKGKFEEAADVIRRDNPLPLICGYVCHRPCETECQASRSGDAVSIRDLKRFVMERGPDASHEKVEKRSEKVAIIGSGPAGLGAADYLAKKGYGVTIFEALPVPGGMMRVGIPDFRLPRNVLDQQIGWILEQGVELKCNTPIGPDMTIDSLLKGGYSAVFLAAGAQNSTKLGIEGEDLEGVRGGMDFIRRVNLGEKVTVGDNVVVIGAGNAAMDIARTAKKLGAKKVTIVYRRSRREIPANPEEVGDAIDEGIEFVLLTNPKKFVGANGKLTGIECIKMKLSEDKDASGRRRPEPIEGSEHIIECTDAIMAVGQIPDMSVCDGANLTPNKWGLLDSDPLTLATCVDGVFAGGDVVAGAGTLSEAVGAGRRAAESIDRYINGIDMAEGRTPADTAWSEKDHLDLEKIQWRERKKSNRIESDKGVYTEEKAIEEAARCLACGGCCECMECVKVCQPKAIMHLQEESVREIEVGAVILSPGYEEFDARLRGEFGFGRYPNVVTNMQFERILSAGGPYGGHVQRPGDGGAVKKVAFIQCVGSRDAAKGNPYCSSVCCMAAVKESVVAISHDADLKPTIFYTDIRAFGKDFDRYYERAKDGGVNFVRGMVSRVVEMPGSGDLRLSYVEDGKVKDETFDLVVLSTGIRPSEESLKTAAALGIQLNTCGFCEPGEGARVATTRPGVFAAGAFQEPKDIPESVIQASAAAAMAMETLSSARGSMIVERKYPKERDITDEPARIGVFICHCGINIASVVGVDEVAEAIKTLPGVVYAETAQFACADNTQKHIADVIKEHKLNRLIVASCTPRTHEALFRDTARECGLNPYLVDMANIRDQCSWVHSNDPKAATEKAIDLVKMSISRSARLFPLMTESIPVIQVAMVLGGGPAGLSAALSLGSQGYRVHLVEKSDRLGGRMNAGAAMIPGVEGHPMVSVHLNSVIKTLKGHVGNFSSEVETPEGVLSIDFGALIVATGGTEYVPHEYLYGEDERVITQRELTTKQLPKGASVVMIQCVGSRNEERPFCSRSCCTDAVRNAIKIKEADPTASVVVLYRDMRTYGMRELEYQKARELGVLFTRYEPENPPMVTGGKKLTVSFTDPELGVGVNLNPDYLVLSTGISPAVDNKTISDMAKVPLNGDGFFNEAHVKLRPVDFATEGIFLAGSAHSPKSAEENIEQGRAAAGRAATILNKKTMSVGGQVSCVDPKKCASCLTCVKVCPYGAPEVVWINGKARVEIRAAKCMGCGSCATDCPAQAIELQNFTRDQVVSAVEALMEVIGG